MMYRAATAFVVCLSTAGLCSAAEPYEGRPLILARATSDPVVVGKMEADWLFQAGDEPLSQRVFKEIQWTRELAARLRKNPATPDLSADLEELAAVEKAYAAKRYDKDESWLQPRRDPASLPDGIVARWTFDDDRGKDVADVSGNDCDGKVQGNMHPVMGVHGQGILLDGASSVVTGESLSAITTGPYTITAWIKTSDTEADILGNGSGPGCFLLMSHEGIVRGHQWTESHGAEINGKTVVNDGRWHHVAQVVDQDRIMLFVDGKLDASGEFQGTKNSAERPVVIGGRDEDSGNNNFAGELDEVCVFDRAIPPEAIKAEFDAGKRIRQVDGDTALLTSADGKFYVAVRRIKRRIFFKDPAVDFHRVLLIDNPFPRGGEWEHQARHRDGMMAVPGGKLGILEGLHPDANVTPLAPAEDQQASFWRPDLSFDGKKVLFCMKPGDGRSFHLYEINIDGTGLRQLTDSKYDDLDPIYLPSGHILFTSTRCNTYIRCMPYTYSYVLARCDADGRNIYLVSRNNECDWVPALLHDGRVLFSRWEYHDKSFSRIQSLWTMNQDGTNVSTFWGNQSVWPDHLTEARPIPGSHRVMFTGLAHHTWFEGSIGILDPTKGFNFPDGLTKVTADVIWPECGLPPVDPIEASDYHTSGDYVAYKTPYPLSEELFLVSAAKSHWQNKFELFLMDVHGNRELVYSGQHHVWHAMPVKPRPRPPVHTDRVAWPGTGAEYEPASPGVLYSTNVYEGVPDKLRGKAKYVRVIQMDHRTYSTWNRDAYGRFAGPTVSAVQTDGVKRFLGTVPIEADGSVAFEVPAGQALHFQLLDEHYRALQTMRSFTGAMPGERRGCVGCHELHSAAPVNTKNPATRREPRKPTPPPWGAEVSIGYERFVQPVLDKHCGECHQGEGKGRKKLDLTLRPGDWEPFKEPYLTLIGGEQALRNTTGVKCEGISGAMMTENAPDGPPVYATFPPMEYLSYTSKLIEIAMSGEHNDVRITGDELRQLIAWVDANCPFRGDEEIRQIPDPARITGNSTHSGITIMPRTKTAPRIDRFNIPQD